MAKAVLSQKAQLIEEKDDDQVVWGSIREEPDVLELDGLDLIDIGRRQWKRDLVAWAMQVAEKFWATHNKYRNGDGVEKEYGEYGVRVIERTWTVTVQWYKAKGVNMGKSMLFDTMRNPQVGSFRMSAQKFKDAKDWEFEAIMKAEDEFQIVRRCSDHLKAMQGPTRGYTQTLLSYTVRNLNK